MLEDGLRAIEADWEREWWFGSGCMQWRRKEDGSLEICSGASKSQTPSVEHEGSEK